MNRDGTPWLVNLHRLGIGAFSTASNSICVFCLCSGLLNSGCHLKERTKDCDPLPGSAVVVSENVEKTFTEDVAFLRQHVETIVLASGRSRIAVVPAYQGRVMTSSAGGAAETSFGWLNYETIGEGVLSGDEALGKLQAQIHVFGGEERFWLGPEGGQFGIYFAPGVEFDFANWKTPAPIDTEPFTVEARTDSQVVFGQRIAVQNHSGHQFDVGVHRMVKILNRDQISQLLDVSLGQDFDVVAYETDNRLTNLGEAAWTRETGALSIWLLGMYKHSAETTVVIPVNDSDHSRLGPIVNDEYFGKVPSDRLKQQGGALFFKADGQYRSKIGVGQFRSLGAAGSYAAESGTLNLVFYDRPQVTYGYVNSMWEIQTEPFSGDAINAYNDGAPEPGADPLGPFYELETSSPAAFLAPGESMSHVQRTIHLRGPREILDQISRQKLGVRLDAIDTAF